MKIRYIIIALLVIGMVIFALGINSDLRIVHETVKSNKIQKPIKLCLITDLHSCDYGKHQHQLIDVIKSEAPDALLLAGDIVDDDLSDVKAKEFFSASQKLDIPSYYVSGNHEYWTNDIKTIKSYIRSYGVNVLEGDVKTLDIDGQIIQICGIDDPEVNNYESDSPTFNEQLENVGNAKEDNLFSVLITHRPERIKAYLNYHFDVITAGHAHGGQWRLPGLVNGLLAPNQGLFPKYAGGRYNFDQTVFIVSRGLARETTRIPRVYNQPELIFIDIEGE